MTPSRRRRLATLAGVVAAISPAAAAHGGEPPRALSCLARYYEVTPVERNGAWFGRVPGGMLLPWDDGRAKSSDERLNQPDLQDMLAIPYRAGAIRPVTDADDDPGRARVDALFAATYGRGIRAMPIERIVVAGQSVRVHRKVAAALSRVAQRLQKAIAKDASLRAFLQPLAGTLAQRNIAGTERVSAHSYGIALDIATRFSDYWRWQRGTVLVWRNRIPQAIVDAFEAEGFIWGGRWYHFDSMHFEYRPELLDPHCRTLTAQGNDAASGS